MYSITGYVNNSQTDKSNHMYQFFYNPKLSKNVIALQRRTTIKCSSGVKGVMSELKAFLSVVGWLMESFLQYKEFVQGQGKDTEGYKTELCR